MDKEVEDAQKEIIQTLKNINQKIAKLNNPPFWRSLVQGILAGFGTVIGATLLIAILITALRPFINTPLVGDWINQIVQTVDGRSTHGDN